MANLGFEGIINANTLSSGIGVFFVVCAFIMVVIIAGVILWTWMQYRAHNIIVEVWRGDLVQGTLKRAYDRGRVYENKDTYQTSFHLWNKRIFIPNIRYRDHIIDGKLMLLQIGNMEFRPMNFNLKNVEVSVTRELDLEFYTEGIRRSVERKAGAPSWWAQYGTAAMTIVFLLIIAVVLSILFYNLKDVGAALREAAEACRTQPAAAPPSGEVLA